MNKTNQFEKCLLCGSSALVDLRDYQKDKLCQCQSCSFVFAQAIPTREELEKHYEGYSRNDYLSPITIKRYNELLDYFEQFRKTGKLIDVGCGIGYFLEEAQKRGWEVYGTEYTDEAIKICEHKGIIMKKGVLNPTDFEAESFDVITSFEVLEHINYIENNTAQHVPQDEIGSGTV
jgi:2-polyprenyl-3-methyl-5-hydroxy-6-metoxy-1,4-benzoquinol methylase